MIVVDSNVIAYYWINGPLTGAARQVRTKDPDWHVTMPSSLHLARRSPFRL